MTLLLLVIQEYLIDNHKEWTARRSMHLPTIFYIEYDSNINPPYITIDTDNQIIMASYSTGLSRSREYYTENDILQKISDAIKSI